MRERVCRGVAYLTRARRMLAISLAMTCAAARISAFRRLPAASTPPAGPSPTRSPAGTRPVLAGARRHRAPRSPWSPRVGRADPRRSCARQCQCGRTRDGAAKAGQECVNSYGVTNVDHPVPVDGDTVFRMASPLCDRATAVTVTRRTCLPAVGSHPNHHCHHCRSGNRPPTGPSGSQARHRLRGRHGGRPNKVLCW